MIKGMDELQKQLRDLTKADYVPALEKGVREAILPEMQLLTPVDTGELRDSEDVVREGDTVSLVAGTDHAVPVEFGTVHMAAQPYMRPSIDTKSNDALKITADEINRKMKQVVNG